MRNGRSTLVACRRGKIDDHTSFASLHHVPRSLPASDESATQINIEHLIPHGVGHLQDRAQWIDAGVVDPDIDAAQCMYRLRCHRTDRATVRYVKQGSDDFDTVLLRDFLSRLLRQLLVQVANQDIGTCLGKPLTYSQSDPSCSAGHHRVTFLERDQFSNRLATDI